MSHAEEQRRYYAANREAILSRLRATREERGDSINARRRELRARKTGREVIPAQPAISGATPEERLRSASRVSESGCWVWARTTNGRGYGQIWQGDRRFYAHRLAYTLWIGPISELDVLHHCDNPPCINPEHLFLGTARDNAADMVAKGRARGGRRSRERVS